MSLFLLSSILFTSCHGQGIKVKKVVIDDNLVITNNMDGRDVFNLLKDNYSLYMQNCSLKFHIKDKDLNIKGKGDFYSYKIDEYTTSSYNQTKAIDIKVFPFMYCSSKSSNITKYDIEEHRTYSKSSSLYKQGPFTVALFASNNFSNKRT